MFRFFSFLFCLLTPLVTNASEFTNIPMKEKGTATYYITAEIAGYEIDLLVDTGAGYSTLNKDMIKILRRDGKAHRIGEIEAVLANGSVCELPIYRITSMNLGGDCILKDIEIAETPANTRNLLGLTALKKAAPFTFSLAPAELILSNCVRSVAEADEL